MAPRVASMLNFNLQQLTGPKYRDLKVTSLLHHPIRTGLQVCVYVRVLERVCGCR